MTETPQLERRDHLSVSTLLDFARCPRRYFYRKSSIAPITPITALTYGLAMHKAWPLAMLESIDAAVEAFKSVWDESIADEKRNLQRAIASISHFHHTHSRGRSIYVLEKPPQGLIPLDETTSEYEVPFALDLGLRVPVIGRIDALVRHRDTGELWGLEFKTSSRLSQSILDSFEMHPQILTYTLALTTVTGMDIKGFFVEGMLVDKMKVDCVTHPVYVYSHHLAGISRWLFSLGASLLAMEDASGLCKDDPAKPFIQNFSACTAYPHFWMSSFRCEYANLCRPADWRQALALYQITTPKSSMMEGAEG